MDSCSLGGKNRNLRILARAKRPTKSRHPRTANHQRVSRNNLHAIGGIPMTNDDVSGLYVRAKIGATAIVMRGGRLRRRSGAFRANQAWRERLAPSAGFKPALPTAWRVQSPKRHAVSRTTRLEQERWKRPHEQIPSLARRPAKFQFLGQKVLGVREVSST